jgi:ATP-dependent DNA helicase RecG
LGQEAAYAGQRGLQTVQAEQMALQYVMAYGKITRKQAAELCKISLTIASDLLGRLLKKGILEMHGVVCSWLNENYSKKPIITDA